MASSIMLTVDNHLRHEKRFIFPLLGCKVAANCDSYFCLLCAIDLLQTNDRLNIDKSLLISEIINLLTVSNYNVNKHSLITLLNQNREITVSLLLALLDRSETQADSLAELKLEGSVRLFNNLQEELIAVTLDAVLPRIFQTGNRLGVTLALNLVTKLFETKLSVVSHFKNGENSQCYQNLIYRFAFQTKDEDIQRQSLLILVKLLECSRNEDTHLKLISSFPQQLLHILHIASCNEVKNHGMDILKELLTDRNMTETLMNLNLNGTSLTIILKYYLVNSDKRLVTKAANCVLNILNDNRASYTKSILDNDLGPILLEVLNNTDELLLECVLSCCLLLVNQKQFFYNCLSVYGIDAIVRSTETLLYLHRTPTLIIAIKLLSKIFERQPKKITFLNSIKRVVQILSLFRNGIEESDRNVSLLSMIAFSHILRSDLFILPIPVEDIIKVFHSMNNVYCFLNESSTERSNIGAVETPNAELVIGVYLKIYQKILRLCAGCGQTPTAPSSTFDITSTVMTQEELFNLSSQESRQFLLNSQNSELTSSYSQESQNMFYNEQSVNQQLFQTNRNNQNCSTLNQIQIFVYKQLDEMMPTILAKMYLFRNLTFANTFCDCLRFLISSSSFSDYDNISSLMSFRGLSQLFQFTSYSSATSSQSQEEKQIFLKRNYLLTYIFDNHQPSIDPSLKNILNNGVQKLIGTPSNFVYLLSRDSTDDVQTTILALNYFSLSGDQLFTPLELLLPELCKFIILNQTFTCKWSFKFSLSLMAECYFKLELDSIVNSAFYDIDDAVELLFKQIQKTDNFSSIVSPKLELISWIFSKNYLSEDILNKILNECLCKSSDDPAKDNELVVQLLNVSSIANFFLNNLTLPTKDSEKSFKFLKELISQIPSDSNFTQMLNQRFPSIISIYNFRQTLTEDKLSVLLQYLSFNWQSSKQTEDQIQDHATFYHLTVTIPWIFSKGSQSILKLIIQGVRFYTSKFHMIKDEQGLDFLFSNHSAIDALNQILSSTNLKDVLLLSDILSIFAVLVNYKSLDTLMINVNADTLNQALLSCEKQLFLPSVEIYKAIITSNQINIEGLRTTYAILLNLLIKEVKNETLIDAIFSFFIRLFESHPQLGQRLIASKWTVTTIEFLIAYKNFKQVEHFSLFINLVDKCASRSESKWVPLLECIKKVK